MIPHGRPPFPLDAPTPAGYRIGFGRGARPVGSAREFFQQLKKHKTKPLGAEGIDDPSLRPVPFAEDPSDIERSVKSFVSESRASIQQSDWESIPSVKHELARKKKVSANTVNLGSNQTVTPNVLFESTKFLKTAHSMAQNADSSALHNIVRDENAKTNDGSLPQEYAVESNHINDMEEAKLQIAHLRAFLETSPESIESWIDLCKIYVQRGQRSHAKKTLQKACEANPYAESLWMEYIELVTNSTEAKTICQIALEKILDSAELWLTLAQKLTPDEDERQGILLEAAEKCPEDVEVWKALCASFGSDEEKLLILSKALECVTHIDLYLSYVQYETDQKSIRAKLSEARRKYPHRAEVYIAAARQEASNPENCTKIIRKAFDETQFEEAFMEETAQRFGTDFDANPSEETLAVAKQREFVQKLCWFTLAEPESASVLKTIVQFAMDIGLRNPTMAEQRDRWLSDAQLLFSCGCVQTSTALLRVALESLPQAQDLWMERLRQVPEANQDERFAVLQEATAKCPKSESFWNLLSQMHSQRGDLDAQRKALEKAVSSIPNNEILWIALAKVTEELEEDPGETEKVYVRACSACPSARMFRKRFVFLRRIGDIGAKDLSRQIADVLKKGKPYSADWKLWLMAIELCISEDEMSSFEIARSLALKALLENPSVVKLTEIAAAIEINDGKTASAKEIFKESISKNEENSEFYAAFIRFLVQAKDTATAKEVFQNALRRFRNNQSALGDVYSAGVTIEPLEKRTSAIRSALSAAPNHPALLWEKAYTLYLLGMRDDSARAAKELTAVDPRHGDAWGLISLCDTSDEVSLPRGAQTPKNGKFWNSIAKNPLVCGHDGCLVDPDDILQLVVEKLRQLVE